MMPPSDMFDPLLHMYPNCTRRDSDLQSSASSIQCPGQGDQHAGDNDNRNNSNYVTTDSIHNACLAPQFPNYHQMNYIACTQVQPAIEDSLYMRAKQDAQVLYDSRCKSERIILDTLGTASTSHVRTVCQVFKSISGADLHEMMDTATKGDFGVLAVQLAQPAILFDVNCVREALTRFGSVNDLLMMEVIGGRSNTEVQQVRNMYENVYKKDLVRQVEKEMSGSHEFFYVSILNATRMENTCAMDPTEDVAALYLAGNNLFAINGT